MTTAITSAPTLPEKVARRGITEPQWRTLMNSLYPGAKGDSVLMVWDYCKARQLDPLKKPCHIVPMDVVDAKTGQRETRDVVMPGIYEYRTTAQRTGEYLGHARPEYGPVIDCYGVTAPEWCTFTVTRWNSAVGQRAEYPTTVYFLEAVAVARDKKTGAMRVNRTWTQRPRQMLTKCAEAAALRAAFPDELGGETTAEEMDGQSARAATVEAVDDKPAPVAPDGYDDWLYDLTAVADEGTAALEQAFTESDPHCREYLTKQQIDTWAALKARATAASAGTRDDDPSVL